MVWQLCPRVFLGASNPVRIADLIAYRHENASGPTQVWSNRGLAGIDGNTSTALGWASACARLEGADCSGVTAVMGDLTFLHDALLVWGCLAVKSFRLFELSFLMIRWFDL